MLPHVGSGWSGWFSRWAPVDFGRFPMCSFADAWERLRAAARTLARRGAAKARIVHCYLNLTMNFSPYSLTAWATVRNSDTVETTGELADQLLRLTRRMHRAHKRYLQPLASPPPWPSPGVAALTARNRPPPMVDLAQRLDVVPRAVTTLVDALEANGLVRREADPASRRVVRVALTEEGTAHPPAAAGGAPLGRRGVARPAGRRAARRPRRAAVHSGRRTGVTPLNRGRPASAPSADS